MNRLLVRNSIATLAVGLVSWVSLAGASSPPAAGGHGAPAKPKPAESGGHGASAGHGAPAEAEPAGPPGSDLGSFEFHVERAAEQLRQKALFTLGARVDPDKLETFAKAWPAHKQRFREQVLIAVRMLDPQTFEEPDLYTLRRYVLLRVRRTLPELPIDEILVSDFTLLDKLDTPQH